MQEPVKWGVVLGACVAVQNVAFAAIGWHTAFTMAFVFLVVAIGLNATMVVLCLRATAADNGWTGQLVNGAILGAVGSVLVFASGWLVTAIIFPDYFAEMAEGYRATFVDMGMDPNEIDETVAGLAATSPVRSAMEGAVGTLVTSVVVAAIGGIWLRRKDGAAATA